MRKTIKKRGGTILTRTGKVRAKAENPKYLFLPGYEPSKPKRGDKNNKAAVIDEIDSIECYVNPAFKVDYKTLACENVKLFRPNRDEFIHTQDNLIEFYARPENLLCYGVDDKYVIGSIRNCELLVLAVRNDGFGKKIFGFASIFFHVIQDSSPGTLKIDVICGSGRIAGAGTLLLDGIKNITSSIGATRIKLESVKTNATIRFYMKHGFTFDDQEDTDCKRETNFDDHKRFGRINRDQRDAKLTSLCELTLEQSPH